MVRIVGAPAVSANNWPCIFDYGSPLLGHYDIPGTTGGQGNNGQQFLLCRNEQAPLWVSVGIEWDKTVRKLNRYECFDPRNNVGSSNHRSATAVDADSADFPQHVHAMSQAEIDAVHAILRKFTTSTGKQILEWGGDWSDEFLDQQHLQLSQQTFISPADVADCIAHMNLTIHGPHVTPIPPPTPPPASKGNSSMILQISDDPARNAFLVIGSKAHLIKGSTELKSYGLPITPISQAIFNSYGFTRI